VRIGGCDTRDRVLIVAEIGNNHEGDPDVAERMIREAAASGVDAVKFQTFQARLFSSAADAARFGRLQKFQLSYETFAALERLARSLGVGFFSTPLDLESARFLAPIVDCFKIASGDNDFYPLISFACQTGKPLVISTGMTDLEGARGIAGFVREEWARGGIQGDLAMLHCVSAYPVPDEEAHLSVLPVLHAALGCTVGYSDHTLGTEACLAAVALGARIIEKHFTLDKNFSDFRDHQLSADPAEMRLLVSQVRRVEKLLGRPSKDVQPSEVPIAAVARRAIVASSDLARGHRVRFEDLLWIRPPVGLPPGQESRLIGRALLRDVAFGTPITGGDVE